jgi:hypothetical protein
MKPFSLIAIFFLLCGSVAAQNSTPPPRPAPPARPTAPPQGHYETVNKRKHPFWGNSTYVAAAVNFARNREYDFSVGRTYGIATYARRGLGSYDMLTWGAGYTITPLDSQTAHTVKAFYDYSFFPFILFGALTLRGEYMYNMTNRQHYLRPSVGVNLLYVDFLYNHTFLLNGKKAENLYRSGFTIRLKYWLGRRNWETHKYVYSH